MAQKRENRKAFLKNADDFRGKAVLIIIKMLDLSEKTKNKVLVEEILHSIIFLGKIHPLRFTPTQILREREKEVRALFPKVFEDGSPQLPRRSPFSCVLDMIVCCFGEKKEEEIKTRLEEFILCVCLCPCDTPIPACEISQNDFTGNAKIIIGVILKPDQGKIPALVNQILHSIFFLGHKKNPRCTPEMILGERTDEVCERYPRPFQYYLSEEPIPCVLNTIERLIGQNKKEIKSELDTLLQKLKKCTYKKFFLSSTVCISQVQKDSVRYYGVSMSTFPGNSGSKAREIMIAASCLGHWHKSVAGAVMTYLPNNNEKIKKNKDENIDGTIKLPTDVRCEAFSLTDGVKMSPCKPCATLFSLQTTADERNYLYGNCAETESLSNMLTNETQVRVELQAPGLWNDKNATEKIKMYLTEMLEEMKFQWNGQFYSPQKVSAVVL